MTGTQAGSKDRDAAQDQYPIKAVCAPSPPPAPLVLLSLFTGAHSLTPTEQRASCAELHFNKLINKFISTAIEYSKMTKPGFIVVKESQFEESEALFFLFNK